MIEPLSSFSDFKRAAADSTLSNNECSGFSDNDRREMEKCIIQDLVTKLKTLHKENSAVLDIGAGCTLLPILLDEYCHDHVQDLTFIDSIEVLARLKSKHAKLLPGQFPQCYESAGLRKKFNCIIVYSVLQYVYRHQNLFSFLDSCLDLLLPEGELLIGDIPNVSMKTRFFSSHSFPGYHKKFYPEKTLPSPIIWDVEKGEIDDSVVFSILQRSRQRGFHSWILPQPNTLPFYNRREDILIRKP